MKHAQYVVIGNGYGEIIRGSLLERLNYRQKKEEAKSAALHNCSQQQIDCIENSVSDLFDLISFDFGHDLPNEVYGAYLLLSRLVDS
jgi:hypothetical protein